MKKPFMLCIIGLLLGTLVVSIVFGVNMIHQHSETTADWFVAWGTLVLALTTFVTIFFSFEQEKRNRKVAFESEQRYRQAENDKEERYRKEQNEREEREKKGRLLSEISSWALEVSRQTFSFEIANFPQKLSLIFKGEYMIGVAEEYFKKDNLSTDIVNLINKFATLLYLQDPANRDWLKRCAGKKVHEVIAEITNPNIDVTPYMNDISSTASILEAKIGNIISSL